jgi:predicted heme/steroid binding protein
MSGEEHGMLLKLRMCIASLILLTAASSWAIPEYAEKTKQGCKICHVKEEGGDLSAIGIGYAASGYVWPPEGGFRVISPIKKTVRFFIGALHIVAAFLWFGTILYVHIILRPGYAARGLPRGEVVLGLATMIIVGITGLLLTISKIRSLSVLYEGTWGAMLLIKIFFYCVMVLSAFYVVLFIGPKLKRGIKKADLPKDGIFDPLTLSAFDGKEGREAYIAYRGNVYNVAPSKLWKNGIHMKHLSGADLTDALPKAPHGEEKLERLKLIGTYNAELTPPKSFEQKAFYFIAYMNLTIVFLVLFVIAYWRWGL